MLLETPGGPMSSEGSITCLLGQLGNVSTTEREAAYTQLWERFFKPLLAVARQRLQGTSRRMADEEDVALDAFASLCRGIESGRFQELGDRDSLWRLLNQITVRKACDLVQFNRR